MFIDLVDCFGLAMTIFIIILESPDQESRMIIENPIELCPSPPIINAVYRVSHKTS